MTTRRSYIPSALLLALIIVLGSTISIIDGAAKEPYPPPVTGEQFVPQNYSTHLPLITMWLPPATTSYYLQDLTTLYDLGYALGQHDRDTPGTQDNLVILDYGYPSIQSGAYGVKLTYEDIGIFHPVSEVIASAVDFAHGYWVSLGNDYASHLTIVAGVNNCCNENTLTFFRAHGTAWGESVNSFVSQISVYNQFHD